MFPFDFANPQNFNYSGPTPPYKYYAFRGKSLINKDEYNRLIKEDGWNFADELRNYNVQDCVVLYNILIKFDLLIRNKFKFNMENKGSATTLSSLAFSMYRYAYIPKFLQYTEKKW